MKQPRNLFNKPLLLTQVAVEELSAIALSENFASSQSERDLRDSELIQRVEGQTGVIEISGVICNKGSWISLYFGECPTTLIKAAIQQFLEKPSITRILLLIDSPGGFVNGVKELSDFIFESRAKKEIVALADPMACSAAYWIGSAASKFYLSSPVSEVGSIGVRLTHQDISGALGKAGVKITEIVSGKYKTLGSPYKPLDEESIELLGESVLFTHELFVEAIQRNRGLSKEEAKAVADGRVYFGSKAVNLKLVDGIMSKEKIENQEDLDEEAVSDEEEETAETEEEEEKAESENEEEKASSEEEEDEEEKAFRAKHPAICQKIFRSGVKVGASKERKRIQSIEEATVEGFEKDAQAFKFKSSKSSDAFAVFQMKKIKERGGLTTQGLRENRSQKPSFSHAPKEKASSEVSAFQDEVVKVAEGIGKQLAAENTFKLN